MTDSISSDSKRKADTLDGGKANYAHIERAGDSTSSRSLPGYSAGDKGVSDEEVERLSSKYGLPKDSVFITRAEIPEILEHMTSDEIITEYRRTRKKVDLLILPMLCWIYICNYLDRTNIASARLGGLEDDLKLSHVQYQTAISVFFVGYVLFQVPSNIVLNRCGKPSVFISVLMTSWGVVSTCCGAAQHYVGLIVLRVLLGTVEAGFFVCCLYYLSCWYTKRELTFRNSILFSGSFLSGAFAGLISAGIIKGMDNVLGLKAWRWCFIIEGAFTVVTVPLALWILPDNPDNTKVLNETQRAIMMWQLRMDVGEKDDDAAVLNEHNNYKFALKLAVMDPKVWIIAFIASCTLIASSFQNFFPSVLETLKFTKVKTLLLLAPPYILAMIATYIWSWHSDKTQERFWHALIPIPFSVMAYVITGASTSIGARYFAMCCILASVKSTYLIIISWMSHVVPRPPLKRAVALAILNTSANSVQVWTPYMYNKKWSPRYAYAMSVNAAAMVLAGLLACVLRLWIIRLNKQVKRGTFNWHRELGGDGAHVKKDFKFML